MFDIVIIGAGPAGLFTAYELVTNNFKGKILIIDKGRDIENRKCDNRCLNRKWCNPCNQVYGVGGGGFSDGKLCVSGTTGLKLKGNVQELDEIANYLDKIISHFLYKKGIYTKLRKVNRKKLRKAEKLFLVNKYPVRHLGSDNCLIFCKQIRKYLTEKDVKFSFNTEVLDFEKDEMLFKIRTQNGKIIKSKYLVIAVGKSGWFWLKEIITKHFGKNNFEANPLSIGVRIETSKSIAEPLYEISEDPKLKKTINGYNIKTHCFCHGGKIIVCNYDQIKLIGGYANSKRDIVNSNFNVLCKLSFKSAEEKEQFLKDVILNRRSKLPIVQRLEDLIKNRSTSFSKMEKNSIKPTLSIQPGNISEFLPRMIIKSIIEFLQHLDKIAPGLYAPDTLFYFPSVEWIYDKIRTNENLEFKKNLFIAGDCTGISQGIISASITGVLVAREITKR